MVMEFEGAKTNLVEKTAHKGAGHRQRLRDKFLQSSLDGFLDYEIVELLLTLGTPRRDCKSIAKEVIKEFGTLKKALDATLEELWGIKGIGPNNIFGLKLFQEVSERYAKETVKENTSLKSLVELVEYLQKAIGRKKEENFMVLYLDSQDKLIDSRIISVGVLNSSLAHPREVFNPAITLRAANIVVAHNHPSGFVEPSKEDRDLTKNLVETGRIIGIELRDHVIVSNSDHFSFQQQLLL